MKRYALPIAAGMALALAGPSMARATFRTAADSGVADGTSTSIETIYKTVKDDKNKNGKRPPGWDRGNKTGWNGRGVPPGQAQRRDNNRNDRDYRSDRDRNSTRYNDRYNRDDRAGRNVPPSWRDYGDRDNRDRRDNRDNRYDRNTGVGTTYFGHVTGRSGDRVTVRLSNSGRTMQFRIPNGTRVSRDGQEVPLYRIRSGERVKVYTYRNGTVRWLSSY